jgi:hypothetical protein
MPRFQSNDDFFAALRQQIEQWCDQRQLGALARILPAYTSFDGLTDGWARLHEALKDTRDMGAKTFTEVERELLNDLIRAAEEAVFRR